MGLCQQCKLPLQNVLRDEARFGHYEVLHRCAVCNHIVIYRGQEDPREPAVY